MVIESQAVGRLTEELGLAAWEIARGYAQRYHRRRPGEWDDIAQDVLIHVCRNLRKLDAEKNLFSYLSQAAYHALMAWRREETREARWREVLAKK